MENNWQLRPDAGRSECKFRQGDSNTCLFALTPYYKQNKGLLFGFLFKPLSGLRPPRGLNKKASEKYPLFIT